MTQTILKEIKEAVKYWWLLLLTGLLLTAVGIWVFASPAAAYLSLSVLFGASILTIGFFETVFAITASKSMKGWGWTLASGLLDIVIGSYLLVYPTVTMAILPFVLGFWLLFRGFSAIGFSFDLKSYGDLNWGWFLLLAIGIIIFAFMILAVPAFGVANIIAWTGLSFIFAGVFRIILAFSLKKWKSEIA
ncbi:MAG: HdeD family acid-resistance protein [Sphingobacteriales bacterium]|nr:MAG: HdeD family acid-resistance protein [Sphingobacteriales bacterium]